MKTKSLLFTLGLAVLGGCVLFSLWLHQNQARFRHILRRELSYLSRLAPVAKPMARLDHDREGELIQFTRQLLSAYRNHDTPAVERMWADDFTWTGQDGMASTKEQILGRTPTPGVEWKSFDDIRVRDYGDFPVVTYRSVCCASIGTNVVENEFFNSLQYRANADPPAERWRVVSALSMMVHPGPPGARPPAGSY